MRHIVLVTSLAVAGASLAAPARAGPIEAAGAWSRPAVAGSTGVGYISLVNRGAADALVGASSPLARSVEIHSSRMAGGVMSMRKEASVAVPAQGSAAFAPGGRHLMFIGLTRTLRAGDKLPATLTFASGAKLQVNFTVGTGLGPPAPGSAHDEHMHH